jgi:hypothetical protein
MKYATEVGYFAMIYIPNITHSGLGIQNLIEGDTQIHRQDRDLISLI